MNDDTLGQETNDDQPSSDEEHNEKKQTSARKSEVPPVPTSLKNRTSKHIKNRETTAQSDSNNNVDSKGNSIEVKGKDKIRKKSKKDNKGETDQNRRDKQLEDATLPADGTQDEGCQNVDADNDKGKLSKLDENNLENVETYDDVINGPVKVELHEPDKGNLSGLSENIGDDPGTYDDIIDPSLVKVTHCKLDVPEESVYDIVA